MICNMDCLHCIHPDCINDQLTPEDFRAGTERDRESVQDNRDAKAQRLADYQKAYRAANREKLAAQKKAYRAANREKVADYQKAYYEANREKVADYQKAYYEANREKLAAQQKAYRAANREKLAEQKTIRDRRKAAGYTLRQLGDLIGVHFTTVSLWERCEGPADWGKLETVFPGITPDHDHT